ncbi:hypothetical protein [Streptomyces sp. NPDC093093]|uniref:hypothetical protein n=1 Tax=Streptomyces sp. NPDC093093 TaxID=3366025 RepID=UPI0037F587D9
MIGDAVFERVLACVRTSSPQNVAHLTELYAGLRPLDDVFVHPCKPVAERRRDAATAQQAFDLVTTHKGAGGDVYEWAEQHAITRAYDILIHLNRVHAATSF